MCNLSQVIYDRGYDKGYDVALVTAIKNLMETTCWNIEESMAALNIPEGRKEYYREEVFGVVSS